MITLLVRAAIAAGLVALGAPVAATVSFGKQEATVSAVNEIGGFTVNDPALTQQGYDAALAGSGSTMSVLVQSNRIIGRNSASVINSTIAADAISATASITSSIQPPQYAGYPNVASASGVGSVIALSSLTSVTSVFQARAIQQLQPADASVYATSNNRAVLIQHFSLAAPMEVRFQQPTLTLTSIRTSFSIFEYRPIDPGTLPPGSGPVILNPYVNIFQRDSLSGPIGSFATQLGVGDYYLQIEQGLVQMINGPDAAAADNMGESWVDVGFVPDGSIVPEPATWLMMLSGFGLIGACARRRGVAAA